jgi:hypothetical protein
MFAVRHNPVGIYGGAVIVLLVVLALLALTGVL